MKIGKPAGPYLLVEFPKDNIEQKDGIAAAKLDSGLYIPAKASQAEEAVNVVGKVVDVGPLAYHKYSKPWCVVGDLVQVPMYYGKKLPVKGAEHMRLFQDEDVLFVLDPEAELSSVLKVE